jgi:hypothetical protein
MTTEERKLWQLINQSQNLSDDIQEAIEEMEYNGTVIPLDTSVTVQVDGSKQGIKFPNPDKMAAWLAGVMNGGAQ